MVEHVLCAGDLVAGFAPSVRMIEGIRVHSRIQKSRPEEYIREKPVSHRLETTDFTIEVTGRIDGVFHYPDKIIIEEIKTTYKIPEIADSPKSDLHWAQAKLYAYLYGLQHEIETLHVRLTYCHPETEEIREFDREYPLSELGLFFDDILGRFVEWMRRYESYRDIRNEHIRELPFPFETYRPGQRDIAVEIYRSIREGRQIIAQAPTGIGKTIAAVFPAVKALNENLAGKIFYLTAKTTGQYAAEQALRTLMEKGLRIKYLILTAKEKICFLPEMHCESCDYAKGYYDRLHAARNELFYRDDFNRPAIEEIAKKHELCPFEYSLDLSIWMDVIICDYNYAFDPRVNLKRFFAEDAKDVVFLADEAHNLVDRARNMFSAELHKQNILEARRTLNKKVPYLYRLLGRINAVFLEYKKSSETGKTPFSRDEPPDKLDSILKEFVSESLKWLLDHPGDDNRKTVLDLFFEIGWFVKVLDRYDACYATCYETVGNDFTIKLFCIDPAAQLKESWAKIRSAAFFSATMTPPWYFRDVFGCETDTKVLVLCSPFDKENLCVMISRRISTFYRMRDQTKDPLVRSLIAFIRQKKGNYIFFFPSYDYMRMIRDHFSDHCPDIETLVQLPGMAEAEREAFLRRFSVENHRTLAGFAVMGGVFGESIDLVGDRLSGAVIVGVGLPALTLERRLIEKYYQKEGAGFEYAYMYPGVNRVFQAAGRVIRAEEDRGAILLIDQRFSQLRYRHLFPENWRPVFVDDDRHIDRLLNHFWKT